MSAPPNVPTPTADTPAPTCISLCAVIIPTASTFLTSSYVRVPPIETLPENVASLATILSVEVN